MIRHELTDSMNIQEEKEMEQRLGEDNILNFVFHSLIDNMHAIIYVTDIETNEILFMSRTMQEAFHLSEPKGKLCWQVLQKERQGPCSFCPVHKLKKQITEEPGSRATHVWEEKNPISGRIYAHYSSLITWIDGRMAYFQHSVDVTDYKKLRVQANVDELTKLYNRRA